MAEVIARNLPERFGESETLKALQRLPDDWMVFYSVGFLDRGRFDRQREIDFVVAHPNRGLVFVEVKGGQVQFQRDGIRQLLDGGWQSINPVNQVNQGRRVCVQYLREHDFGFVPAFNLVVFPTTARPSSSIGQELELTSVFADGLEVLDQRVEGLLSSSAREYFSREQLEGLLRPCLCDLVPSPANDLRHVPAQLSPLDPADKLEPSRSTETEPLKVLLASPASSFTSFGSLRALLLEHRSQLELLWEDILHSRSDFDGSEPTDRRDSDALIQVLRETQRLVAAAAIEVGIFGQVKRGKSSLLNAMLEQEVSAVGMLPKTAIPVTVECSESPEAVVTFDDEHVETMDLDAAREMMTQEARRRRSAARLPLAAKVLVRMPISWLPPGIRLTDTPGLSDPSLSEVYEDYAMAELGRVAAAIFMTMYPPGPDAQELRLIRSLSQHGIDKAFFVVNLWPGMWNEAAREEISTYMSDLIESADDGAGHLVDDDRRVFLVNLATGPVAAGSAGTDARDSGVLELRRALESFLSDGILARIAESASRRLLRAADVIERTLQQRERSIREPVHLEAQLSELDSSVERSKAATAEASKAGARRLGELGDEMTTLVRQVFDNARLRVESTRDRSALEQLQHALSIETATLEARVSGLYRARSTQIASDCRRQLLASLDATAWSTNAADSTDLVLELSFPTEGLIERERAASDHRIEARAAGTLLGAMSGGGAGLALIAAGPLGIIAGAAIGLLLGDALGGIFADPGNAGPVTEREHAALLVRIQETRTRAEREIAATISRSTQSLKSGLAKEREAIMADASAELHHVERLLTDPSASQAALADIAGFQRRLTEIVG
jgi:hypothetical protein